MNINIWLENFKSMWTGEKIDDLSSLFVQDVEYWETPHSRLGSFSELRDEWEIIKTQRRKKINFSVVSSVGELHTVKWSLSYSTDDSSVINHWAGLYLVRLDESGICDYFYQVGEKK